MNGAHLSEGATDFHQVTLIHSKLLFRHCQPRTTLPIFPRSHSLETSFSGFRRMPFTSHTLCSLWPFISNRVWICVCMYARVCVCVCVCVNVRATVQYKSTEGSLVSGLMEEWMTNKNSEMPFIVASWVYPFLFSFYDFLNLFSPQGHPPPFLISCAAVLESAVWRKDTPHPVKKWFLCVPGLLIPTWHICHPLPLCCNNSSWSE